MRHQGVLLGHEFRFDVIVPFNSPYRAPGEGGTCCVMFRCDETMYRRVMLCTSKH